MAFAGINYLAIAVAAVAAWLTGALWYTVLGGPWMRAVGITPEQMAARKGRPGAFLPFVYALIAAAVMAFVLAGLIGHLGPGQVTFRNGIISGAFSWFGFVL